MTDTLGISWAGALIDESPRHRGRRENHEYVTVHELNKQKTTKNNVMNYYKEYDIAR